MSLDYNLGGIKNHKDVCFVGEGDEARMNPVTESLIFTMLSIGMPKITDENVQEFFIRAQMVERIYGPPMNSASGPVSYSLDNIRKHVGMSTNATEFSKAKFSSHIGRILRERASGEYHDAKRALEVREEAPANS